MSTQEQRQEWRDLADGLHRNYQDDAANAITALLADVDRLTERNTLLAEQLRLANERADTAQLELGRLNGNAAQRVREVTAERDALAAELAKVQAQLEYEHTGVFAPLDEMYKRGELTHEQYVNGLHLLYDK